MESQFVQELDGLREDILTMMRLAEKAVDNAVRSVFENDPKRARDVIDNDEFINDLECAIDARSLKLLALQQPVAIDLRFIVGCMRMIVNVERLGDEAVNIAERALILAERPQLRPNPLLIDLGELAKRQVRDIILAFGDLDAEAAKRFYARTAEATGINLLVFKENTEYMIRESRTVERAVQYSFIARDLRRICDQTSNISESIIFIKDGKNHKHAAGCGASRT
jgi:phosphate transport system protein